MCNLHHPDGLLCKVVRLVLHVTHLRRDVDYELNSCGDVIRLNGMFHCHTCIVGRTSMRNAQCPVYSGESGDEMIRLNSNGS